MDEAEALDDGLSRQMLKRGGSIDQASVKKNPSLASLGDDPICERDLYRASGEGGCIRPGQGIAPAFQFLGHDPPAWFVDGGKSASSKLCQEGRFTSTGAA